MSVAKRTARQVRAQDDNEIIEDVQVSLRSWSELTQDVQLNPQIMMAMMTNRPELLRAVSAEAMSAEEVGKLYDLIATLMETNVALQKHAEATARRAKVMQDNLKGVLTAAHRLEHFANFRQEELEDAE